MTVSLAPFRGPLYAWLNSDHPGKLMDRQMFAKFWYFWPTYSENKYPTTPMFYDLLYYKKIMIFKKIQYSQKNYIPLLVVAPRDLRVCP